MLTRVRQWLELGRADSSWLNCPGADPCGSVGGVPAGGDGSVGPDGLRTLSIASLHCVLLPGVGAGWMSWPELPTPTAVILLGVGFGAREGVADVDPRLLTHHSPLRPTPRRRRKGIRRRFWRSTRPRWSRCPSSTSCSTTSVKRHRNSDLKWGRLASWARSREPGPKSNLVTSARRLRASGQ